MKNEREALHYFCHVCLAFKQSWNVAEPVDADAGMQVVLNICGAASSYRAGVTFDRSITCKFVD